MRLSFGVDFLNFGLLRCFGWFVICFLRLLRFGFLGFNVGFAGLIV